MDEVLYKKIDHPDKAVIVFVDLEEIPGYIESKSSITTPGHHIHVSESCYLSFTDNANNAAVTWPSMRQPLHNDDKPKPMDDLSRVFEEFLLTPDSCLPTPSTTTIADNSTQTALPPHPQSLLPEPLKSLSICVLTADAKAHASLLAQLEAQHQDNQGSDQNIENNNHDAHHTRDFNNKHPNFLLKSAAITPFRSLWLLQHHISSDFAASHSTSHLEISSEILHHEQELATALWDAAAEALANHNICVIHVPGRSSKRKSTLLWSQVLSLALNRAAAHNTMVAHVVMPPRETFATCGGYQRAQSPPLPLYDIASILALSGLTNSDSARIMAAENLPNSIASPAPPPLGHQPTPNALLCSTWWPGVTRMPTPPTHESTINPPPMHESAMNTSVTAERGLASTSGQCASGAERGACGYDDWRCRHGWLGVAVTDGPMTLWQWLRYLASAIGHARKYGA